MSSRFQLTAVFQPVENGWVQARIQEIPGVITAAPSMEEARELLPDALHEYLLALGDLEAPEHSADTGAERWPFDVTLDV